MFFYKREASLDGKKMKKGSEIKKVTSDAIIVSERPTKYLSIFHHRLLHISDKKIFKICIIRKFK